MELWVLVLQVGFGLAVREGSEGILGVLGPHCEVGVCLKEELGCMQHHFDARTDPALPPFGRTGRGRSCGG